MFDPTFYSDFPDNVEPDEPPPDWEFMTGDPRDKLTAEGRYLWDTVQIITAHGSGTCAPCGRQFFAGAQVTRVPTTSIPYPWNFGHAGCVFNWIQTWHAAPLEDAGEEIPF